MVWEDPIQFFWGHQWIQGVNGYGVKEMAGELSLGLRIESPGKPMKALDTLKKIELNFGQPD